MNVTYSSTLVRTGEANRPHFGVRNSRDNGSSTRTTDNIPALERVVLTDIEEDGPVD